MDYLALARGLVTQPSLTFHDIGAKARPLQAGATVFAAGALLSLPRVMEFAAPKTSGVVLILLYGGLVHMLLAAVVALVAWLAAVRLVGGEGDLRESLIAVGLCYFPWAVSGAVGAVLVSMDKPGAFLAPFFSGWFAVLLVLALRQVHELTWGRAAVAVGAGGLVGLMLLNHLEKPRLLLVPMATDTPEIGVFLRQGQEWETLPAGAVGILRNPGFEDGRERKDGPGFPRQWDPARGPFFAELERVADAGRSGSAAVVVRREGPAEASLKGWRQIVGYPLLTADDVPDWTALCKHINDERLGAASLGKLGNTPGKIIWQLLEDEDRACVSGVAEGDAADPEDVPKLVSALNKALGSPDFYDASAFERLTPGPEAEKLVRVPVRQLSRVELLKRNRLLLEVACPGLVAPFVRARPGRDLYLSAWLRCEDATTAMAMVLFDGKASKRKVVGVRSRYFRGTTDGWVNVRLKTRMPIDANLAQVSVLLWGRGTMWADDVFLYQQPAAEDAVERPDVGAKGADIAVPDSDAAAKAPAGGGKPYSAE